MKTSELIELLQHDLRHERKHLAFYTQASAMVTGLHREELKEFFEEEAQDELKHVMQFAELIAYLGGIPGTMVEQYPSALQDPKEILQYVVAMEDEVANRYAERLRQTHEMEDAALAYVHVFYEDQISDSWKTAREVEQMLKGM